MTSPVCLNPANCPVPDPTDIDLRRLRIIRLDEGHNFHAAYHRVHWPGLFNPSEAGNARFSPLEIDPLKVNTKVVPTLYGAESQTVALLETTFHDVHASGHRIISEPLHLAPRGLVTLTTPLPLPLVDLSDEGLERLYLGRGQLVACSPEHYACTREWATSLHDRHIGPVRPAGLLWQSRVAELAQYDSPLLEDLLPFADRVFVLFGDRLPTDPLAWGPGDPHYGDLTAGEGRLLAEQIAEQLGALIVPI